MLNTKSYFRCVNLQLFAEGGNGGDGGTSNGAMAGGGLANPVTETPLSEMHYGKDIDPIVKGQENGGIDKNAEFEKLIKGDYKEQYDKKIQDTIQKRLKSSKETVDKYNSLAPTLELLGRKYGVDASDTEALNRAIEEDDTYYEDEALEKGLTVEQLKSIKKMERENAELKRQMQEEEVRQNADRLYASWMEQSEATKTVYPQFDLEYEMNNPRFVDLLRNNVDVKTAYEVIHMNEIIPAAMQFTAKVTEQKLTNKIMSGSNRPIENGNRSQSPTNTKSDVSQLSKADRDEIARRVARGEKIRF